MNKYIVHTAIKCSDDKVRRLSYDLTEQTEGSVQEFGRVFAEIEKRFPDTQFWIQKYPEHEVNGLNDPDFVTIHEPVVISYVDPTNNLGFDKNTDNEV